MIKCCPTCQRPFPPEIQLTGKVRQRLYDYISKHPEGVSLQDIADYVYAEKPDGGPKWAESSLYITIQRVNRKLLAYGKLIKATGGPGSVYRIIDVEASQRPTDSP
jgi:hypothetical protein